MHSLAPVIILNLQVGRAMAQAVSRRPITEKVRVRAQVSPCGICGGQSGSETAFFSEYFSFSLPILFHRGSPYWHISPGDEQQAR
jgi:hypothetical protein